jgi:hypothetical protein
MWRTTVSLLVVACLLQGGIARAQDEKKGKKGDRPVRGTIQKIDKESSLGTVITIEIMNRKKDESTTTEKQEKKFTVTSSTKVEKLSGKKDSQTHEDAKADDLRTGQNVILTVKGDKVEKIEIVMGKKKK